MELHVFCKADSVGEKMINEGYPTAAIDFTFIPLREGGEEICVNIDLRNGTAGIGELVESLLSLDKPT